MDLPVSIYALREAVDGFKPKLLGTSRGQDALQWLEFQAALRNVHVRHMGNNSEKHVKVKDERDEVKIIRVDGFSEDPAIVYEYVQCKFHSGYCPECRKKFEPYVFFANGKSSTVLERELEFRFNSIRNAGYKLVVAWSCEWKALKQNSPLANYVSRNCIIGPEISDNGLSEEEIFSRVQDGTMEGYLLVSAVVPLDLREYFSDVPPLFKKIEISREDLSAEMREYCERHQLLEHPTEQLVSGYHMEDMLYYSSYIQFLMDLGVKFYNLKKFYQFRTASIFKDYLEKMSEERAKAQAEGNEVRSLTIKALANSLYGSTLRSQLKDTDCRYAYDDKEALRYAGEPLLSSITECADGITEFTMKKGSLRFHSPITIGSTVLFHAKLLLMRFYYSFIKVYVPDTAFHPCYTDTGKLLTILS